jgi:hypothetical protein
MTFTDHYHAILLDCHNLGKFRDSQSLQRGRWNNIPAAQRKRLMDLGYVKVDEMVVYLTREGLTVLGYKEATA